MPDLRTRSGQLLFLVVVAVILGALYVGHEPRSHRGGQPELAAAAGATPLAIEAPAVRLIDQDARSVALESYRGRVVLVNFWATWCGPCVAEIPSLVALARSVDPKDIAFVSIAEDDSWPPVLGYLKKHPLPFDVFRDQPPRVEGQFQVSAYPTSFLIGRDGQALYRFDGGRDWDTPQVRDLLASLGVHPAKGAGSRR